MLNFRKFGSADNHLIIMHGLFGSLDNWATLAKQYAEDFTVWIVDMRNHGKSPHLSGMSYQNMADDLEEFVVQQHLATFALMGHSMGGKAAMLYVDQHSERIEKLIIADISPRAYPPKHNDIIDALMDFPLSQINNRNEAEDWLKTRIEEEAVILFLLKNLSRDTGNNKSFRWKMNLPEIVKHYDDIIGAIELKNKFHRPVLIMKGGRSTYINKDDENTFYDLYPHADLICIEKAGHWLHAEAQSDFFEHTQHFLLF